MTSNQIIATAKAAVSEAVLKNTAGKTVVTTDATATALETFSFYGDCAGIIKAMVSGMDSAGGTITGVKIVRFKCVSGTITLGTVTDLLAVVADGTLSSATFTLSVSGSDISVVVTGVAATEINWKSNSEINVVNGVETAL